MAQGKGPRPWWTEPRTRAAQLVAEGNLNQSAIAEQLGVSRVTLIRWNREADFQERVRQIQAQTEVALMRQNIGLKSNRLADMQDIRDRLYQVINERAAAIEYQEIPGWKSGLLVHSVKAVGPIVVNLYVHDATLVNGLLAVNKHAAIEMGEWTEKKEVTGEGGGAIKVIIEYSEQLTTQDDQDSDPEAP